MKKPIIFGSSGFIGKHLSTSIKSDHLLADVIDNDKTIFCDVREPIDIEVKSIDLIFNLAAVHTTPGHDYYEYFETNVKGAENICDFARKNNINNIVFVSSIAPYGTWEDEKFENSLLLPTSAYGMSKLYAEEIHKRWQSEDKKNRKLIILRPGVVFGKGENGNFTRLYKSLKNRQFLYPGRKSTKKAAIYVKDLVRLMLKMSQKEKPGVHLFNTVYHPIHDIKEICETMCDVINVKYPSYTIPSTILIFIAFLISKLGKLLGKNFGGINPDRVKKLMISTNINGEKLKNQNYFLSYDLQSALDDWYADCDRLELK